MSYGAITGQKPETPDIPQPGLRWELVKSGPVEWQKNQYGTIKNGQYIVDHLLSVENNDVLSVMIKLKGDFTIWGKNYLYSSGKIYSFGQTQLMSWSTNGDNKQINYKVNFVSTANFVFRTTEDTHFLVDGAKMISTRPNDFRVYVSFSSDRNDTPSLVSSNLHYDIYVGKISI